MFAFWYIVGNENLRALFFQVTFRIYYITYIISQNDARGCNVLWDNPES